MGVGRAKRRRDVGPGRAAPAPPTPKGDSVGRLTRIALEPVLAALVEGRRNLVALQKANQSLRWYQGIVLGSAQGFSAAEEAAFQAVSQQSEDGIAWLERLLAVR